MPLICTCLEGHRWEHPGAAEPDATPPPCPTCGALAAAVFADAQPAPAEAVPFDPQMLALEPACAGASPAALAQVAGPVVTPAALPPAVPRPHPPLPQRPRPEAPRRSAAGPVVLAVTLTVLAFVTLISVAGILWFQQSTRHAHERAEAERQQELQRQEHFQLEAPLRQEVERAQRAEAQLRQEFERAQKAEARARQAAEVPQAQLLLIQIQIMEEKRRREGAERALQDARAEADRLRKELVATRAKAHPPDDGAAKKVEAELREQLAAAKLAAVRAREKADVVAYAHGIALASWEAWANHPDQVGPYLRECPEGPRGWEWHYLARVYGTGLTASPPNKTPVMAVGFSADGKRVAAAGRDGSLTVRDSDTGAELARTAGRPGMITVPVFSAAGDRLAASWSFQTRPSEVKVWDFTGREIRRLSGLRTGSSCRALSADGKRLVTADPTGEVVVWDVDTGKAALTLTANAGPVQAAAFSPDGKWLAAASRSTSAGKGTKDASPAEIRVWDASTGRLAVTFKTVGRLIPALAFTPDGGLLISATSERGIQFWDPSAEEGAGPVRTVAPGGALVRGLAFSPDGKALFAADTAGIVRVYEVRSGKRLRSFPAHQQPIHGLAISPDGARLATGSFDRTVRVWTVAPRPERLTLKGHTGPVHVVAFSPDGKLVASAGDDRTVRLRDASGGREVRTLAGHTLALARVVFCPQGKRLATVSAPAAQGTRAVEVKVWDIETGKELCALAGHAGDGVRVVFSPGGRQLAVLSPGKAAKIYDPTTGQEVDGFEVSGRKLGRARALDCLAVSPDGSRFAIASAAGVQVTEVRQRNGQWESRAFLLKGQATPVTDLALTADGGRLVVASGGQLVTVWDAATGNKVGTFRGSRLDLRMAALSRGGERLAAANGSRVVLCGPINGKRLLELPGHGGLVTSVAFSPDGTRIAAGGSDGAVLIWDGAPAKPSARAP